MRYYRIIKTTDPKPTGKLPDSYGIAQNCANCVAYNPTTTICSTYNAAVLPNYWCNTWKGKT